MLRLLLGRDKALHLFGPPGLHAHVDGKLAAATKTAGYIPGNCGQGMEIGYDVANSAAEITDTPISTATTGPPRVRKSAMRCAVSPNMSVTPLFRFQSSR